MVGKGGKTLRNFASALAGAYFLFFMGGFCGFSVGKRVFADAHPREKLASYTTYFSQKEGGRCENIRLAAASLDGIALQPCGELSFNGVVGARTAKNGYKIAKIISQGEFVDGVGGGVCQVSTTLYNAALLSGLTVLESCAHSLRVGYVPPSRDAMVSSKSDLRLYNPHSETVYLRTAVGEGYLRISFYGKPTEFTYEIESRTLAEIPPPDEPTTDGKKTEYLRPPVSGLKSEAYLKTYQNGVLVSVKRLRQDVYAPQAGKLAP